MDVRLVSKHALLLEIAVVVALLHLQCMNSSIERSELLLEGCNDLMSCLCNSTANRVRDGSRQLSLEIRAEITSFS